jgi:hypothetical protein
MEAAEYFRQKAREGYAAEVPNATEGMSGVEKFRAGVGQGMVNIARHGANLVGMDKLPFTDIDTSKQGLADAKQRDQALLETGAGRAGSIVGEIAATAPIGGLAAGGARALGGGLVRAGLAEGAAQGLLTADPGQRLRGAAEGAAFGAVLPGGARLVKFAGQPLRATKEAKELIRRGVRLTPGELNPTGRLNQWEQALQSSGVGGATIRNAREGAMQDFQRAAAEAAGGRGTKLVGRQDPDEWVRQLENQYNQRYDNAIGGYNQLTPDIWTTTGQNTPLFTYPGTGRGPVGAMVDATSQRFPGAVVKPSQRTEMLGVLEDQLSALRTPTGQIPKNVTGRELQRVRSDIRAARRGTDEAGERALLGAGERKMTQSIESQINPADAAALQAVDADYGGFKVFQDAVARSRAAPGGFTPFQLESSIAKHTDLGEYARGGGGPLRTLSKAGRKVFEQRVQPTGERQVLTGLFGRWGTPGAASALAAATKIDPKKLAGMTPGQRALNMKIAALRRKFLSELQAGQSLGTAGMIQANQE